MYNELILSIKEQILMKMIPPLLPHSADSVYLLHKYGNMLFLLCQSLLLKITDFHPNLKTKIMSPKPPLTDLFPN